MPWVKDNVIEEAFRFLEPSRVQLMLCGEKIAKRATFRDRKIELWLSTQRNGIAA